MEPYFTIGRAAQGRYEEKKSEFIASAAFVDTEEKARDFLETVRAENRTARHNVYAYVLRESGRVRYSDDGEPARTAGTPVLEVIRHEALSDVIVVVTRYFGGILLGTGGLVRAYTRAAQLALEAAGRVRIRACVRLEATLDYALYDRAVQLAQSLHARLDDTGCGAALTLTFLLPEEDAPALLSALTELSRGRAALTVGPAFYTAF